jgi:hypothetical protein
VQPTRVAVAVGVLGAVAVAGLVVARGGADAADPHPGSTTTHGLRPTPQVTTVIDPLPVDPSTLPIGDVRRLPPVPAGLLTGTLTTTDPTCTRHDAPLGRGEPVTVRAPLAGCRLTASPGGRWLLVQPGDRFAVDATTTRLDLRTGRSVTADAPDGPEGTGAAVVDDRGDTIVCSLRGPRWSHPPAPARQLRGRCGQALVAGIAVHLAVDDRTLVAGRDDAPQTRLPWPLRRLPVVALAPDASAVAGVDFDPGRRRLRIRVADAVGEPLGRTMHLSTMFHVSELRVAHDGVSIALRGEGGWSLQRTSGTLAVSAIGPSSIRDVTVSPDGRWYAVATAEGVAIVDSATLAPRYSVPVDAVSVVWRPTS